MENVDADILVVDLHLHVLRLGQHGHGRRRGMDAPLRLRLWHALYAVNAAFVLQPLIRALSRNVIDRFLDAAKLGFADVQRLGLKTVRGAVILIHAAKLRGKKRRFLPARARADLEDTAPLVVFVLGQKQNFQFLFKFSQPLLAGVSLVGKKATHFRILLGFRAREGFLHFLLAGEVFEVFFRRVLKVGLLLGILLPRPHVRNRFGVGKLCRQILIPFQNVVESL